MALPERDHTVSIEKSDEYIQRYQRTVLGDVTAPPQKHKFHSDQVVKFQQQEGVAILVAIPGQDENGKRNLILAVEDENEKEIGTTRLELSFP